MGTWLLVPSRTGGGGLNIDASRVGTEGWKRPGSNAIGGVYGDFCNDAPRVNTQGRFPSNLICKGIGDVVGLFPVTTSNPGTLQSNAINGRHIPNAPVRQKGTVLSVGDSGSASRFFYAVTGITK